MAVPSRRSTSTAAATTDEPTGTGVMRARSLCWLVALIAFVASALGAVTTMLAAPPPGQLAASGCPEHAPPPDPCPEKGTAKHAAGDCCLQMACSLAVLPSAAAGDGPLGHAAPAASFATRLAGRAFTKDPPPPRV